MDLISARPEGLYCPPGDFYIDPWRAVERAVINHGHSDHARSGSNHYLTAAPGAGILRKRLGADIRLETLAYGEIVNHHGVTLSLHPAGHVLGSAQVRLEYQGEVWVASDDYTMLRFICEVSVNSDFTFAVWDAPADVAGRKLEPFAQSVFWPDGRRDAPGGRHRPQDHRGKIRTHAQRDAHDGV